MDSNSAGNRSAEKCGEELNERIMDEVASASDDVPTLLTPGVQHIFPLFANMLDIKSFMRLAMTCKGMYEQCMEDKRIRINIEEKSIIVTHDENLCSYALPSSDNVESSKSSEYFATLRQLRCSVTLEELSIGDSQITLKVIRRMTNFLEDIGVKMITKFSCNGDFRWNVTNITNFLKKFKIKQLYFDNWMTEDFFRTILQLNLDLLECKGYYRAELLLDTNSTIEKLILPKIFDISKETFLQILWKIQTGSFKELTLHDYAIEMRSYDSLPFAFDGRLPTDRPLVFAKEDGFRRKELWFLHWHGGVTKCTRNDDRTMNICKCDPADLPPSCRAKKDVFEELSQKRSVVVCSSEHFCSFYENNEMVDPSFEGDFPEERPLWFKDSPFCYWQLTQEEILEQYFWDDGLCYFGKGNPEIIEWSHQCNHPVLAKYLFWKIVERSSEEFQFSCNSREQFRSWFEGKTTFAYDYLGPFPTDRTLVFEVAKPPDDFVKDIRVVVRTDGSILQCLAFGLEHGPVEYVTISVCAPWSLPAAYLTAEAIATTLLEFPFDCEFIFLVEHEKFLEAFEKFPTISHDHDGSFPEERQLVIVKKAKEIGGEEGDERFFLDGNDVAKCVWKEGVGYFLFADPKEYPSILSKELVKDYLQGRWSVAGSPFIFIESLRDQLEGFKIVPYDYSGPLPTDRPLFFENPGLAHSCHPTEIECECSGKILGLWILWDQEDLAYVTWEERTGRLALCPGDDHWETMPSALKSKDYLKCLLELPNPCAEWLGESIDFYAFFEGYTSVEPDHTGPIPEERPLVVKNGDDRLWFLREDNRLIDCRWWETFATVFLANSIPPIFRSICSLPEDLD